MSQSNLFLTDKHHHVPIIRTNQAQIKDTYKDIIKRNNNYTFYNKMT